MPARPIVAVIGGTIWGNRGAEAMLVTTIGKVRAMRPGASIIVFSYYPDRDRQLVRDENITILSNRPASLVMRHLPSALLCGLLRRVGISLPDGLLSRPVRALRQCHVLLDISGISFADGREKTLPFNILNIWPAMLLGVPVVKLAQALGPFNNPVNRAAARLFLPRCQRIFARGAASAAHLKALPLPPDRWEQAPDVAFLYDPGFSLSVENQDRVSALEAELARLAQSGCPIVGLVPSSLVYGESTRRGHDYVGQFVRLIDELGPSHHFVALPNATREAAGGAFNNDLVVIDALERRAAESLPPEARDRLHVVSYDINTAASRQLLARCDVVVTSRFHGMVSSLSLGIPTVVVGWGHKYEEVLAAFGLERFAVDFNNPSLDIPALVRDVQAQRDSVRERLHAGLAAVQAQAARQFDYVEKLLP